MGISRLISTIRDISFKRRNLEPPVQLLVLEDDFILFKIHTIGGPISFAATARVQTLGGEVIDIEDRFTLASNPQGTEKRLGLAKGFLHSVSLRNTTTQVYPGTIFAVATLAKGEGTNFAQTRTFFADVVTLQAPLSWPPYQIRTPLDAPGKLEVETFANPPAGNAFTINPATGIHWTVLGLNFRLTTDANVATRWIQLRHNSTLGDGWKVWDDEGTPASSNTEYGFFRGIQRSSKAFGKKHIPLPEPAVVHDPHLLVCTVNNIQAGDQVSGINLLTEKRALDL